jgi:ribosome-binding factor A
MSWNSSRSRKSPGPCEQGENEPRAARLVLVIAMKQRAATPNRAFKVADQIQRDLTELIARELKDPRVGMVTIQAVEVTPDYAHAKVFFSVLVGDPHECEEALNQAAGFLRNGLFKRLHIHTVPTLHFQFDRTTERAADLNALIAKAVSSRAKED